MASPLSFPSARKGFTLIELLVVIAIIAILSVVVVLTLNPAELLRQSRDSSRLSDMATMNSALGIYAEDIGGSMGTPSTTYISIPDPSATTTLGDQCQGLILPAQTTSSGWNYQCGASSTYRNVNGSGWIPLNFTTIASGAPLGSLPQDPLNQTSSNLFYTYTTDGKAYEVTSVMESSKYRSQLSTNPPLTLYPGIEAAGTNLALSGLWDPNGLVGYWNFEERSGSSTLDQSGNGNTGSWTGTPTGNNGTYYTGGKVGSYAGYFDGSTDYVDLSSSALASSSPSVVTIAVWVNISSWPAAWPGIVDFSEKGTYNSCPSAWGLYNEAGTGIVVVENDLAKWQILKSSFLAGWNHIVAVWNGTNASMYINGIAAGSSFYDFNYCDTGNNAAIGRGSGSYFNSLIDDVRIYNRALSAAEIRALYNAQK
jgi:prepilin-type N-terminal cleavage/methylation domain-containing protein